MHIQTVTISNFRNFGPNFSLELKPFTILLGENNIGKSNLLAAITLILGSDISSQRRRMLEVEDINYTVLLKFKTDVADPSVPAEKVVFPEVSVTLTLVEMDDEQASVAGDWFIDAQLTTAQLCYKFSPSLNLNKTEWIKKERERLKGENSERVKRVSFPLNEYRYSVFGGGRPSMACEPYLLRSFRMECLDALRDAQRELVASGEYRLLYRILSQHAESNFSDILKALAELEEVVRNNPKLASVKASIASMLNNVSLHDEQKDANIDFHFSPPESSEVLKKLSLVYGSTPIDVSRNGLGRNNLLFISLILSHLSAQSFGQYTCFRLVSVEEPEAHLHPHLEDHLAGNIESLQKLSQMKMQIILTSHSAHIAAKLNLANIAVMFKNAQTSRVDAHYLLNGFDENNPEDKHTISHLEKFIDATKSRMFFARRIILVEGYAEQILLPILFRQQHPGDTLEKHGISIVNVGGLSFRHFLKIIKNGYFLRCLVLRDRDAPPDEDADTADALKSDFSQPDLIEVSISKDKTFELDLAVVNQSGKPKEVLLRALCRTKPKAGPAYEKRVGNADLNPGEFFDQIKRYKTEFASNLFEEVKKQSINIPEYIKIGFAFLVK